MAEILNIVASIVQLPSFATARAPGRERKSGLRIRDNPQDPEVDIVLVHGLGADSDSAWSDTDASAGKPLSWPWEQLPSQLRLRARITTYDYDTKFRTPEYLMRRTLLYQTGSLTDDLAQLRREHGRLPIVFLCHSLGGIVVKNALVSALVSARTDSTLRDVCSAVGGIIFLGTPHTTSPTDLANSILRIVQRLSDGDARELHGPSKATRPLSNGDARELRERSKTLAFSLERFTPLAARMTIHTFLEKESDGEGQSIAPFRNASWDKNVHATKRDHVHLCKFSKSDFSKPDDDLRSIIAAVNDACIQAKERLAAESLPKTVPPGQERNQEQEQALANAAVPSLGWVKTLDSVPPPAATSQVSELDRFFGRWDEETEADMSVAKPSDAWPVTIVRGDPEYGTTTALQYARQHRDRYGSLIWINASTRKSIELSFREVHRRITSNCEHSLDASTGALPPDDQDLNDEELQTLTHSVAEWLERPQRQKWLLVIDNLSRTSSYPSQPTWTSKLQRRYTWRELLMLFPSVTGWRGHVIICTTDTVRVDGLKVISCEPPESREDGREAPRRPAKMSYEPPIRQIVTWWRGSSDNAARERFSLALVLSDKECPRIPLSLLYNETDDEDDFKMENWPIGGLTVSDDYAGRKYIVLPGYLLDDGPRILAHRTPRWFDEMADEIVGQASCRLFKAINSIRDHFDVVFGWHAEAQLVQNIAAMLRRWHQLDSDVNSLLPSKGCVAVPTGINWASMARVCESHSAYNAAAELYKLEQGNYPARSKQYLELQLHYAHSYQLAAQDGKGKAETKAEATAKAGAAYRSVLSTPDIPFDLRITGSRQLASWRASQGQYAEAVQELSEALARAEDPSGSNANSPHVMAAVGDLATYLAMAGSRYSAGCLLQRLVLSLQETRGDDHPSTLAAMEALSVLKQEEGALDEAHGLLRAVQASRERRLGSEHPVAVLGRCKVAAVLDLGGDRRAAEPIYRECGRLLAGARCLGPSHPSVFYVRENLARCLLAQGKRAAARTEFSALLDEIRRVPGMYSAAVRRRIGYFVLGAGAGAVDDYELDLHLSKRNTLGVGDLEDDGESDSSGDEMPEFWDGESDEAEEDEPPEYGDEEAGGGNSDMVLDDDHGKGWWGFRAYLPFGLGVQGRD